MVVPRNERFKRKLFLLNCHCNWCGVRMILKATKHCRNVATLDHIYHCLDPRRKQPGGNEQVLACDACNKARGVRDHLFWVKVQKMSVEYLAHHDLIETERHIKELEIRNILLRHLLKTQPTKHARNMCVINKS